MDINESSNACQGFYELHGVIKNMLPMRLETPSFTPCGLGYTDCTGMLEMARRVSLGSLIRMFRFMNWLNLSSSRAISSPCLELFFFGGLDTATISGSCLTAYLTKFVMRSQFSGILEKVVMK